MAAVVFSIHLSPVPSGVQHAGSPRASTPLRASTSLSQHVGTDDHAAARHVVMIAAADFGLAGVSCTFDAEDEAKTAGPSGQLCARGRSTPEAQLRISRPMQASFGTEKTRQLSLPLVPAGWLLAASLHKPEAPESGL